MISALRSALLVVSLTGCSTVAVAAHHEQARAWLERMADAMHSMSYQGTFIYVRGGEVETMRITHLADEHGVRERIYSLNGSRREIVRDKEGVRCVLGDPAAVVEDETVESNYFPELPLSELGDAHGGYRLETGKLARIAGHAARRVSVSPADKYRYGYDFWIEQDTGLLLQWVLVDASHRPLAKLMFTDFATGADIDLDEIEPVAVAGHPPRKMKGLGPEITVVDDSAPRWQPASLPPGFRLASHNRRADANDVYEHLVYSDGLAAVSVYVERKAGTAANMPRVSRLGTNNAYIRNQGDLQITVIGEVPAVTVKTIANEMARSVAAE